MRQTGIKYTLDLDEFVREVKQIPNVTDKQLDKMVRAWTRRNNQVTREMARASKEAEKAARAAADRTKVLAEQWDHAGKVASTFSGQLGSAFSSATQLGQGLGGLVTPAGLAAAGVAAVGFAAVSASRAMWSYMDAAAAAHRELEQIAGVVPVSEETVERMRDWERASRAAEVASLQMRTALATQLAPTMTDTAHVVTGLKLGIVELTTALGDFVAASDDAAKSQRELKAEQPGVGASFGHTLGILGPLVDTLRILRLAGQGAAEGLAEAAEEAERLKQEADEIANLPFVGPVYDPIALARERAARAAKALAEAQRQAAAEAAALANAESMLLDLRSDAMSPEQRAIEAAEQRAAQIERLAEVVQDEALLERLRHENSLRMQRELLRIGEQRQRQEAEEEERQRRLLELARQQAKERVRLEQQTQRQIRQANMATAASIAGSIDMVAQLFVRSREDMSAEERRAALFAFRVAQSAAVAQATINTALAVSQALAHIPPPANIPAAIAAGIAGAAQVAVIATQSPPEFPRGGLIRAEHLSADHGLVGVQAGEGVVSRRGMQRLGEDGLARLNRGEPPAPMFIVNEQRYRHRIFDRFVRDNILRPGPLGNAVSDDGAIGHSVR